MYYEKASALLAADVTLAKDAALQSQVLLTQGLLLFATDQVSATKHCIASRLDPPPTRCTLHLV